LLGINNIQRKLGMTASLLVLPPLVGLAIVLIKFNPESLNIAFWIMVFSKAVNYALTQPTIKQLYIPTTKDTKYKATAWIETFGSRLSKAGGSSFAGLRSVLGVNSFLSIAALASMGMIGIWVLAAMYIAKKYNKAIKDDTVVC
jgi:AAA family ATP:ADP antiporter